MKYNLYWLGLTIILSALYSCHAAEKGYIKSDAAEISKNELDGRKFKLVSMYPNMNITIAFNSNTVYGFSAINNYSSSYLTDGGIFSVQNISATKKTDFNEECVKAENKYLEMLRAATSYELKENKLIIYTLLSSENLVFEEL